MKIEISYNGQQNELILFLIKINKKQFMYEFHSSLKNAFLFVLMIYYSTFLYRNKMIKYNKEIKQLIIHKDYPSNKRISFGLGKRSHNWWVLMNQRKYDRTMNLIDKQFETMISNMNNDKIVSLLDFNIQFYENQLTLLNAGINTKKMESQVKVSKNNSSSSGSSSEYSSSNSEDNE